MLMKSLREIPVISYWPFTECQQIYNQAINYFQRERIDKWAMWYCIVFISRQDWLENAYMPYLTLRCHISHCEIKSHRIWLIWKPVPIRFIRSHRIFRPSYNILWRNKHKSPFVVFITSLLHINKGFWLLRRSFEVTFIKITLNFIKSHLKICLISQISVHSLWHVWNVVEKQAANFYFKFLSETNLSQYTLLGIN